MKKFENVNEIWSNYKKKAQKFAQYNNNEYPIWGLLSEIGEVVGKYAKFLRGDKFDLKDAINYEVGDCFWMLSEIDEKISMFRIHDRISDSNLEIKSIFRNLDENYWNKKYNLVFDMLCQVLYYYQIDFQFCLDCNIEKLTKRKLENKINGNGDIR